MVSTMTTAVYANPRATQVGIQLQAIEWASKLASDAISGLLKKLGAPFLVSFSLWFIWLLDKTIGKGTLSSICFDAEDEAKKLQKNLQPTTKKKLLSRTNDYEKVLLLMEKFGEERNFLEKLIIWDYQINHFCRTIIHLGETTMALRSLENEDQEEIAKLKDEISALVKEIDFKSLDYTHSS